jgi:hypothetical protein
MTRFLELQAEYDRVYLHTTHFLETLLRSSEFDAAGAYWYTRASPLPQQIFLYTYSPPILGKYVIQLFSWRATASSMFSFSLNISGRRIRKGLPGLSAE